MISVILLLTVIWGAGSWLGWPRGLRWGLTALLFAAILLTHAVLPADHPLPQALGGSFAGWATLAGALVLIAGYARGLAWMKARAEAGAASVEDDAPFSDGELDRYARHIVLREIGGPGQMNLKQAKVLVVGAGGLGSPALLYLAAAGVGTIGVIDDDHVSNSNLQRQVLYGVGDIDTPKVFAAKAAMEAQNPNVVVRPYHRRLTDDIAEELMAEYDLILEGSDNFATRYLVNRVAAKLGKPVVAAALTQWEGQISIYDPASGAPCYQCVFPEIPAPGLAPSCAEAGVIGPLPGVMGSMMAVEAVKVLANAGEGLRGRLMIYDALYGETRNITVKKRADCPICGSGES